MEIKRDAYLQQLIERKDNGMIKVITGIRRCGKSFLLFTIFKRYLLENGVDVDHIIEIALDGIENEELRDPKVCFKYIKDAMKDDGKYYLLLDEVQFMLRFEEVLNSLNIVTLILMTAAGMLAFIVLYNLNNINITERRRELATIKVLGFYDLEVAEYVYRENILLTIIGALVGAVFGKYLHAYIITSVETEVLMYIRREDYSSYI